MPRSTTAPLAALGVLLPLLSACTTLSGAGQSSGATAPGPTTSASIIAAMNGGLIGGGIGRDLSEGERRLALQAEYRALEYTPGGQAVTWKSESGNRYGEVVAAQPYRVGSQDCRQYSHKLITGGQPQEARGTACRNADGSWTPLT